MSSSTDSKEGPKAEKFPGSDLSRHSSAWSYATKIISSSEDLLRETYQSDPWLWEFVDSPTTPAFGGRELTPFPSSRERFMADSALTLQRLQSFEKDLRLHGLAAFMVTDLADISPKLGDCFIYICAELIARDKDQDLSATPESAERAATMIEPYHPPASKKDMSRHLEAANKIMSWKERLLENQKGSCYPMERRRYRSWYNFRQTLRQARTAYSEKTVECVARLFNLFMETDAPQVAQVQILLDRSETEFDHFRFDNNISPLRLNYRSFVYRVEAFVEIVAGHRVPVPDQSDQTTNVQLFFQELRKYGAAKWEQFVPLYRKIQELNDTVESQKQMITALAYRHLIEHLPDQEYYKSTVSEKKGDKLNEKDYWKLMWEDMVLQELSLMVKGDFAPRDLTTLFDYSFKLWRRDNKTATSVPREKFKEWPNYRRGEAFYGELSNNIHLYQGKQETTYDIHDSNWSRTDRTILFSLRPRTWPSTPAGDDPDLPSTVNWSAERKARGLPEKR